MKTKYRLSGQKKIYTWVKPSKASINHAFCNISISAGVTQLKQHEIRTKHAELAKSVSQQSKF